MALLPAIGQNRLETSGFKVGKLYAGIDFFANPWYDNIPLYQQHINVSAGYQFTQHLGLGIFMGYYRKRLGSRYPAISMEAPFWGLEYRMLHDRFFGKVALGHMDWIDAYSEGPVDMGYNARRLSPAIQLKAGVHFGLFFTAGILGLSSGPLQMRFWDYTGGNQMVYYERFYFQSLQMFLGISWPGFRKQASRKL